MLHTLEDIWEDLEEQQSKPRVTMGSPLGEEQPLLEWKDLEKYTTDEKTDLTIGRDNRVYGIRGDVVQCWAPLAPTGPEQVYLDCVRWGNAPPLEHLAHLFEHFFQKYDQEVIMLVGQKLNGSEWLYFVPPQVGTGGGVKWDIRGEAAKEFTGLAVWIGTIHSHPGNCTSPSTVDVSEWADPLCSGIHMILGNDGSYTYHGAIVGKTFPLKSGTLEGVMPAPVWWRQSGGRSLGELLRTPPPLPPPTPTVKTVDTTARPFPRLLRDEIPHQITQDEPGLPPDSYSSLACDRDDLDDLRIVFSGNAVWIMTSLECSVWMSENPSLSSEVEIRTLRIPNGGEPS